MLHSIGIIAVAAIVTLFIRAIPFVLFGGKREVPATVIYLGKVLPPAIMVILVVYCVMALTCLPAIMEFRSYCLWQWLRDFISGSGILC